MRNGESGELTAEDEVADVGRVGVKVVGARLLESSWKLIHD